MTCDGKGCRREAIAEPVLHWHCGIPAASDYIYLRSLFDSGSSGGHEMGPACWVRATSSGAVMVGDAPDADWPGEGRPPVRGGHTIREAAVPSSPGLKGINFEPLPGCRAPWRSARVRGTGWWCCLSSRAECPCQQSLRSCGEHA